MCGLLSVLHGDVGSKHARVTPHIMEKICITVPHYCACLLHYCAFKQAFLDGTASLESVHQVSLCYS